MDFLMMMTYSEKWIVQIVSPWWEHRRVPLEHEREQSSPAGAEGIECKAPGLRGVASYLQKRPPWCIWSVVDQNLIRWHMTVYEFCLKIIVLYQCSALWQCFISLFFQSWQNIHNKVYHFKVYSSVALTRLTLLGPVSTIHQDFFILSCNWTR